MNTPTEIKANVIQVHPLTDSIVQLYLAPEAFINYYAGQYLQLLLNQQSFSYSIANAPLGDKHYELHIRHSEDNAYHQQLMATIKNEGVLSIRLPLGECHLQKLDNQKPILFIAAGTGFAPIKAMIEQLLVTNNKRSFELYWGARAKNDLYMDDKVIYWQRHVRHFQYASLLSNLHKGALTDSVLKQHKNDLHHWQIVLSGPFEFIYTMRDRFIEEGVSAHHLFSDAFSFETKN